MMVPSTHLAPVTPARPSMLCDTHVSHLVFRHDRLSLLASLSL